MPTNSKAYNNAYHARRSPEAKAQKIEQQAARKRATISAIRAYKEEKGCMDCGVKDYVVLEFDHRDPGDKAYNVSNMLQRGKSLANIFLEIEKCDVVCANCHRRRTAKVFWV